MWVIAYADAGKVRIRRCTLDRIVLLDLVYLMAVNCASSINLGRLLSFQVRQSTAVS
jgi:hypothetical protein